MSRGEISRYVCVGALLSAIARDEASKDADSAGGFNIVARLLQAALDRLKPSILLHGEQLCATEVTAASHILKMLDLEHKVREAGPSNEDSFDGDDGSYEHDESDGNTCDVDTHDDAQPRLPIRMRRRLDLLQRATTESERQYATKVLQTECPNPRLLAKYKRAYKWVVGFCTWKYKNPATVSASGMSVWSHRAVHTRSRLTDTRTLTVPFRQRPRVRRRRIRVHAQRRLCAFPSERSSPCSAACAHCGRSRR